MLGLDQKVAIVTGAAAGMGEVTAQRFVEEGTKVIATDLQKDKLDKVVNNLNKKYDKKVAIAVEHNVANAEDWENVVERGLDAFGYINVLVNNAAIAGKDDTFKNASADEWDKVMSVNGKGTMLGIKSVQSAMVESGGGSIINISSLDAYTGAPSSGATYVSSKGAVQSLTKFAAIVLGPSNIRVNSIHPGAIGTDLIKQVLSEDMLEGLLNDIPLGKLGEPVDVANTTLFLASDYSKYISGSELVVDGGLRTDN